MAIPTYDEIITSHGDPKDGAGGSAAVWAARAARDLHAQARDAILDKVRSEQRSTLHASEEREHNKHRGQVTMLDALIDAYGERERRTNAAYVEVRATGPRREGGAHTAGRGGEGTYARGAGQSFFLDMARQRVTGDPVATTRLQRHHEETDRAIASGDLGKEYRVNPNRVDGQGGYFVAPAWLIDEYVTLARPSRTTANLFNRQDLPTGTDSINLPKVNTGSAVGVQTADGGSVTSQDLTDTFLNAPVRTLAGQQDIALQLLDQSSVNFDEIMFADLLADYNKQLDVQILAGTGTGGQLRGLLNISGFNTITNTTGSPTVITEWPVLAQAKSRVENSIFKPADSIVMSSSRWNWHLAALDTQNRPFVVPGNGFNPMGISTEPTAEGAAGSLLNLPVYADPNMPANLGAGSNEDRVFIGRFAEMYLYEGALRTRTLMEVLSGTLQVRCQLYNYVACIPDRRPSALSIISGTGQIVTTALAGF